jgi:Mn2+/Fe2+ NRAMP family transporter
MQILKRLWRDTGPGLVVAATGLGAGDIVAAAVAGAEFGTTLLWAVAVGGLLKFCLNEGIGRWQLITGSTLLEGWMLELPRYISWYFAAYLVFWSFMVAAAMMSATGLAAYGLWPVLSVTQWGMLHAVVAFVIVLGGAWRMLEGLMKFFIALMAWRWHWQSSWCRSPVRQASGSSCGASGEPPSVPCWACGMACPICLPTSCSTTGSVMRRQPAPPAYWLHRRASRAVCPIAFGSR